MPILKIFSKAKPKKTQEKPKIIADYRERGSLVPSELIYLGFNVEFKDLKVADYLIKDVAIERKTISDFLSSMTNKRLLRQIEELQQYKNRLIIVEGIEDQELYNDEQEGISGNAIRGFLLSILLKHKTPVILSKGPEDTAKFLLVLAKRKEKELSLKAKKKASSKKEQMQFILEGFPGIGPATAKKLLKEYKTLKAVLTTPLEDLKSLIGKKAEIFKLLEEKC
jgi:Fanconi anemia group M protein